MRRRTHVASVLLLATMALAASEAGCGLLDTPFPRPEESNEADPSARSSSSCGDLLACGQGSGGEGGQPLPPPRCVPDDGQDWAANPECGVFVSAKGNDSDSGTPDGPVKTFERAIELALAEPQTRRVYACAGDDHKFTEEVKIPGGVTIFGGLDCSDGWRWTGTKTLLTAEEGQIPLRIEGKPGTVRLADLHVMTVSTQGQVAAQDEERPGDGLSSIAVIVDGVDAHFKRCVLEAGDAAPGADGAPYVDSEGNALPAPEGANGQPGEDACFAGSFSPGAEEVANDCGTPEDPSDDSKGGWGGDGRTSSGEDGDEGDPKVGDNSHDNGGDGEDASDACTLGGRGDLDRNNMPVAEAHGGPGQNASTGGSISSSGYIGTHGTDGERGAPGRGGGGGGGARGVTANDTSRSCPGVSGQGRAGASGGSGGAGGCGGKGGRGGRPGGSSIALLSINASISFEQELVLITGNGGAGGDGGIGQDGGEGGNGGPGGKVVPGSSGLRAACAGGRGGDGGMGGPGGGGQGGHSLGMAFLNSNLAAGSDIDDIKFTLGNAGRGGEGGTGPRADGKAETMLEFQQ